MQFPLSFQADDSKVSKLIMVGSVSCLVKEAVSSVGQFIFKSLDKDLLLYLWDAMLAH